MIDLYLYAVVLFWLVFAAWDQYHVATGREAMDRQRAADRMAERMDAAATDAMTCDVCHSPSRERELVALYDDAALCCIPCADQIKVRRGRQEAA